MHTTFTTLAISTAVALTTMATSVQADSDPTSVFNSHIQGFTTGDLDMVQSNLTEETVLIIPGATYTGVAEFSEYITGQMQEFGQEGVVFEMGEMHVSGKIVYISWSAETPDNSYIYATETYLVEDGKIAVQTVGWIKEPK